MAEARIPSKISFHNSRSVGSSGGGDQNTAKPGHGVTRKGLIDAGLDGRGIPLTEGDKSRKVEPKGVVEGYLFDQSRCRQVVEKFLKRGGGWKITTGSG